MNTLIAYAMLTVLACILWSAWRKRSELAEASRRERRRRMEINRDARVCRRLARLPVSEEADD